MAIVEMQKLSVCADKKHRKGVLEELQLLGVMQVENDQIDDPDLKKMDTRNAAAIFDKNADILDQALTLLKTYGTYKGAGGLFAEKKVIGRGRFSEIVKGQQSYMREADEIVSLQKQIDEAQGIIEKDKNRIDALQPWMSLDIPMDSRGTRSTAVLIGTVPGEKEVSELYACASEGMEDPAPVDIHVAAKESGLTYVAVLCLKKEEETVENNLRAAGFAKPQQMESGIPSETAEKLQKDIADKTGQIEKLKQKIADKSSEADEFEIASDYYRTRAEKYRLLGTVPQTENVFFLEGWVPKEKADAVSKLLENKYDALVEKEEITQEDFEPTLLHNNRFSESAEGVLESYGLPTHGRVDPTFIMSIFYVFFFGMMLSDAGYGIVMSVACGLLLAKKKNLDSGIKKTLKLFFWCGLSTTFWGFMYGGFFGDAIDVIAKTFFGYTGDTILKPLWFEPLKNPMRLLVWCMLFGLIHLFTGLGIKGYELCKKKDFVGFFSDIIAWYFLVGGLVLILLPSDLFASISGMTFTFPAWVNTMARVITIIGLVVIVIMGGRDHKNWAIRIALGLYDIYGITSWLSDVLSYSRLLALGLATGVIASVVNMMAAMGGRSVIGVILFVVIFLLGHTLNIGINALGAYVHTNRLQFVEFFGKFYDAGGRPFKPFKTNNKYIQIKEEKVS